MSWRGRLEDGDHPPDVSAAEEPPATAAGRETEWTADHSPRSRDTTPALGHRGGPASWRAAADAQVALARPDFADARWSYLYRARETEYAAQEPAAGQIAAANRRMREASIAPDQIHGPVIHPPVWTWEVPLYFWVGGLASGSAFIASACDAAGDHRSAAIARKVALGAVTLAPPLLIADLGRPGRFLNMLRIFKPRSPMNMGAWCLIVFSASASAAVGADLLGQPRQTRALGVLTSFFGGYLGSYTGILLATTAVPLWMRSRSVLGPIFICTATASGAAATRLALVTRGMPSGHPTRTALRWVETSSIAVEMVLSRANARRLGAVGDVLHEGRSGRIYRLAETTVTAGVATRLLARRVGPWVENLASVLSLGGALAFRFAWVEAGKASARDHATVAAASREPGGARPAEVPHGERTISTTPQPLPVVPGRRLWGEAVRRLSLGTERFLAARGLV